MTANISPVWTPLQSIIQFVEGNGRKLDEAVEFHYIVNPLTGYGDFQIQFKDNTGITGTLAQGLNGWGVHTFQFYFSVSGQDTTVTFENGRRTVEGSIDHE